MGGTPLFALALVGMPVNTLPLDTIRLILEGGESICAKADIPMPAAAIDSGPNRSTAWSPLASCIPATSGNTGARPGDKLILDEGLGVGL